MTKQILPNKLRVLVSRRPDEVRLRCLDYWSAIGNGTVDPASDPDHDDVLCASEPPGADFANVQQRALDLLNIDIKFPSEHTVCGRRYDGEMQYYFYHPARRTLLVVAWLLEATDVWTDNDGIIGNSSTTNAHMQLLIDEFRGIYDANEEACRGGDGDVGGMAAEVVLLPSDHSPFHEPERSLRGEGWVSSKTTANDGPTYNPSIPPSNHPSEGPSEYRGSGYPSATSIPTSTPAPGVSPGPTIDPGPWDPFHPDIQRTIHFWGYDGSLTEVPCTDAASWRIMDVPVRISIDQLELMREALFNNRDPRRDCAYTSNHYMGSVARPIDGTLPYYKCTRDDYVGDDERKACGSRRGCADHPFGPRLGEYVEPIVHVTSPPSEAPTTSASPSESPSASPSSVSPTAFPNSEHPAASSIFPSGSSTNVDDRPI